MKVAWGFVLSLCCAYAMAQYPGATEPVTYQSTVPTGACTQPVTLVKVTVNPGAGLYQCISGAWVPYLNAPGGTLSVGTSLQVAGGTPMSSQSSANSQIVTCPPGGTSTQYCGADGAWHTQSAGGVTQIMAGANVTIAPTGGTGAVTINATGGGGSLGLSVLGTITSAQTWNSTTLAANYTPTGTNGTPAIESAGAGACPAGSNACLLWNATGTNAHTDALAYDGPGHSYFTRLTQNQVCANVIAGTASASSYGISVGLQSWWTGQANWGAGVFAHFDMTNSATAGQLSIIVGASGPVFTTAATSPTSMTFVAGDNIQVCQTQNLDMITASAMDLTRSETPAFVTYQFTMNSGLGYPSLAKFAVWNEGGVVTLTNFTVTSNAPVGADLMALGDSKSVSQFSGTMAGNPGPVMGLYAQGWFNSFAGQLRIVNESGGGEGTADALRLLPEVISLHPKLVIIGVGRNDGSTWTTAFQNNYLAITNGLTAAGIPYYNLLNMYEAGLPQTQEIAWLNSTYPGLNIDPGIDSAAQNWATDGTHPNIGGYALVHGNVASFLQAQGVQMAPAVTQGAPIYPSNVFSNAITLSNPTPTNGGFANTGNIFSLTNYNAALQIGQVNGGVGTSYVPLLIGTGQARTATTTSYLGTLGQTNEGASANFALLFTQVGGAASANRFFDFQTMDGSTHAGNIRFNANGGGLYFNSNSIFGAVGTSAGRPTFATNVAATNTSMTYYVDFGQSTDATNPAVIRMTYTGNATPANDSWGFQSQAGGLNTGVLAFNQYGGQVLVPTPATSDNSANAASTAFVKNQAYATQLSIPAGTPTYTAGTNVTSVACASGYTCTNTRGELTIVGGTATTGTIATVNFSATLAAAPGLCNVIQQGGAALFGVGHGTPSTTAFTITAGITVAASTVTVDYICQP